MNDKDIQKDVAHKLIEGKRLQAFKKAVKGIDPMAVAVTTGGTAMLGGMMGLPKTGAAVGAGMAAAHEIKYAADRYKNERTRQMRMREEAEQVDEANSKHTATIKYGHYAARAREHANASQDNYNLAVNVIKDPNHPDYKQFMKDSDKHMKKFDRANQARKAAHKIMTKEELVDWEDYKRELAEAEQLDEISKKTVKGYLQKSSKAGPDFPDSRTFRNKMKGHVTAQKKLGKGRGPKAKVLATEEAEQLDEISQKTKDAYIKRATTEHGMANHARRSSESGNNKKAAEYWGRKEKNRKKGLVRAFKEQAEQIDEISMNKLADYAAKTIGHERKNERQEKNRAKGLVTAMRKAAGIKVKVPATGSLPDKR